MAAGGAIYVQVCSRCHEAQGGPSIGPNLARATVVDSRDPTTVVRIILKGVQSYVPAGHVPDYSMPAFPALSDRDLADVATYIRNFRGNHAAEVTAQTVKSLRRTIAASPE